LTAARAPRLDPSIRNDPAQAANRQRWDSAAQVHGRRSRRSRCRCRPLGEVSPVVKTLARSQFDDYVKRGRVFAHPRLVDDLGALEGLTQLLSQAIDRTE